MATQLVSGREALRQLLRDTVWQSADSAEALLNGSDEEHGVEMRNLAARWWVAGSGFVRLLHAKRGYATVNKTNVSYGLRPGQPVLPPALHRFVFVVCHVQRRLLTFSASTVAH
jgi:hypothetical protein